MDIYVMPFFINKENYGEEINMASQCLKSLSYSKDVNILIFNQGCLSNKELEEILKKFNFNYKIIGISENVGITLSRYIGFRYIIENYSDINYVIESHIDMIFPPNWQEPLIQYLDSSEEPMISPAIITNFSDNAFPNKNTTLEDKIKYLSTMGEDKFTNGFVHPVIHKLSVLKEICAYDVGFLTGTQGYEDDSILLGYNYYMGTSKKWLPKIYHKSYVYHKTLFQRFKLQNLSESFNKNYLGLKSQYGAYGLKELGRIYPNNDFFIREYRKSIINPDIYKKYSMYIGKNSSKTKSTIDKKSSRFIVTTDEKKTECLLKFPNDWWSRCYEYAWASNFLEKNDTCLDAACGVPHPFKFYLASICKNVYACDIDTDILDKNKILSRVSQYFDEEDVKKAEKYINKINLSNSSLTNLPYEDNKFDKVYCISVLEHLSNDDKEESINEFYRVLKKDGLLVLTIDYPTAALNLLVNNLKTTGFKFVDSFDCKIYPNAIYSKLLGGLYCFRLLLKK
ncbi:methyltransferase domain-containing protein [Clostridium sp. Mt-5]|uniref:Methyltransferase domain-containing protein n=1 Tax=Clostridium moutaii TaxID=3240932 RepID=A0ABV4BSJ8_9CLOT